MLRLTRYLRTAAPMLAAALPIIPIAMPVATLAACRAPATALGDTPAKAREHADEALFALAARFGPHLVDSAMLAVRMKFARAALTPSRLLNDSAAWTSMTNDVRLLEIAGEDAPTGYRLHIQPRSVPPHLPGEYRRTTELRSLGDDFEWRVRDELAIGTVQTSNLGHALTAALEGVEQNREPAIRAAYRAQLPRTTAALGRLFSLDTIETIPRPDGATDASIGVRIHPEWIAQAFPHWSRYLDKYVSPAAYRVIVFDNRGDRWWEAHGADRQVTLHFRVTHGALAPLEGPPRRMPDTLFAQIDFTTKAFLFHFGVRQLTAQVTLTRLQDEAGFTLHFRQEPLWVLPPLVGRMLRAPLRRPFAGDGAMLSYAVHDGADSTSTVTTRDYRIAVRESAIVRWFGKLGNTALNDFREGAEREADAFEGQAWHALRADLLAFLSPE